MKHALTTINVQGDHQYQTRRGGTAVNTRTQPGQRQYIRLTVTIRCAQCGERLQDSEWSRHYHEGDAQEGIYITQDAMPPHVCDRMELDP